MNKKNPHRVEVSLKDFLKLYPWSKAKILCFEVFAWASIEVAACVNIWALVNLLVSIEKSASLMFDIEPSTFVATLVKLDIVESNLFSETK